jgi:transcriptional regulator NrdR family protein
MSRGRPAGVYNGLACPYCHSDQRTDVIDSRDCHDKQARRRRHLCLSCTKRFTTYEVLADEYERLALDSVNWRQLKVMMGDKNGTAKN